MFRVRLPLCISAAKLHQKPGWHRYPANACNLHPAAGRPPSPGSHPPASGLRILAAEDNQINQMVLAEFLRLEAADYCLCW